MSTGFPYFLSAAGEGLAELHQYWGRFLALGIALVAVGAWAIAYPAVATVATVEFFGIVLLFGAGAQLAIAPWARHWPGFFLHLFVGLLYLFVGTALLERPALGAAGYTLMLAVFFVAGGVVRTLFALTQQFHGWVWVALSGAVSFLLGMFIWRELPVAAFWVIGTFVGIDLIFNGVSWIMLGLGVRQLPAQQAVPSPSPAGEGTS